MGRNYLCQIGDRWYFRIRIPKDLRPWFPGREIKVSLKTKSYREACQLLPTRLSATYGLFFRLRTPYLSDEERRSLATGGFSPSVRQAGNSAPPSPPPSTPDHPPAADSLSVAKAVGQYLQDGMTSGRWTPKTTHEVEAILSLLAEVMEGMTMQQVTYQVMLDVKGKLARLPANLRKSPEYRAKPVAAILQMSIPRPLHPTTLNKYLIQISAFFKWSVKHGFIDRNYAEGLTIKRRIDTSTERLGYSPDDVARMLEVPIFTGGCPPR